MTADQFSHSLFVNQPKYRVLICIRGRCAPPEQGQGLERQLLALLQAHGLDDSDHPQHTTCRVVQCLGVCQAGTIVTIHPGPIRYRLVDEAALKRIFKEHLLNDRPVTELMLPPLTSSAP